MVKRTPRENAMLKRVTIWIVSTGAAVGVVSGGIGWACDTIAKPKIERMINTQIECHEQKQDYERKQMQDAINKILELTQQNREAVARIEGKIGR